jgi:hypothetical protein
MDAILVDQVTALYVVLAVAMVVFGGVFAWLWRLNAQAGLHGRPYKVGVALFALLVLAFGGVAAGRLVSQVDTALWLVMVTLVAVWCGTFYLLWSLDSATRHG